MSDLVRLLPKSQGVVPQVLKELAGRLPGGVVLNSISVDGEFDAVSGRRSDQRQIFLSGEVHGSAEDLEAGLMEFLLDLSKSRFYRAPVVLRKDQVVRGAEMGIEFDIVCTLN
jgi:hypothetical protein